MHILERIDKKEDKKPEAPQQQVKPRPMVVHGSTYRMNTPVGTAFITINTNGGVIPEPLEVFISISKPGSDISAMAEGLARTISLALRFASNISPMDRVKEIVNQLEGIGGARVTGFGKDRIKSLPDAVAKVLKMHYNMEKAKEASLIPPPQPKGLFDICPACGEASFAHEEGCKKCYGCGYSECS